MTANRNIKIYGTLLNATVNAIIGDADHNDALAYAYQLYDDRFGESTLVNNFQDIINKRVTAISYADGITTIKNRAGVHDGVPYMFVVEGASNLNGNTTITGSAVVTRNMGVNGDLTVGGNEKLKGTLDAGGAATFNDGATITNGNLTVTRGDFFVQTGNATIAQDLEVGDDLTVGDKANIGGEFNVVGPTTMTQLTTSGNVFVGANQTIQGDLTVNGNTNLKNVTTDDINCKTLEASDGLIVTGNASINDGNLSVNNGNLNVAGDTTLMGHLGVTNGVDVSGNTSITGTLDVASTTTLNGATRINNNLFVDGTGTFTGNVIAPNIGQLRTDVDILNAPESTDGSVRNIAAEYISKVVSGAPEAFDTLMEFYAWITTHASDAADMNNRILANKENIDHLTVDVENHESRITKLEGDVEDIDDRLSNLETWSHDVQLDTIPILRNEVASLRARVANAESAIANNTVAINNAQASINSLSGSLGALANRVAALEGSQYWELSGGNVSAKAGRAAQAAGFYDTTV